MVHSDPLSGCLSWALNLLGEIPLIARLNDLEIPILVSLQVYLSTTQEPGWMEMWVLSDASPAFWQQAPRVSRVGLQRLQNKGAAQLDLDSLPPPAPRPCPCMMISVKASF